jgi:hypothetical protein
MVNIPVVLLKLLPFIYVPGNRTEKPQGFKPAKK